MTYDIYAKSDDILRLYVFFVHIRQVFSYLLKATMIVLDLILYSFLNYIYYGIPGI